MLRMTHVWKPIGITIGLSLLAACGGTGGSADEDAAAEGSGNSAASGAGAKTVMVADVPHACDVLTRDLAASVLQLPAAEIQPMDRPGKGMDEPCTWYYASDPAVGIEQQLTLVIGAPPLTYVNSERDDIDQMRSRLKVVTSIRDTEIEHLGDTPGGRLFAADRGSRTQLFLATGIRVLESADADPMGELLITVTLNGDLAHEERVKRLQPVVESAARAL